MDRVLTLPARMAIAEYPEQTGHQYVRVDFGEEDVNEWCLNLCLLQEQIITALTVQCINSPLRLRFSRLKKHNQSDKTFWDNRTADILLSPRTLALWISYFAGRYLSGVSEVPHIDTDFISEGSRRVTGLTVTFWVAPSKPSASVEEMEAEIEATLHDLLPFGNTGTEGQQSSGKDE